MDRPVEVVQLELVGHLAKGLQGVLSLGLLKTVCFMRFVAFLWKESDICNKSVHVQVRTKLGKCTTTVVRFNNSARVTSGTGMCPGPAQQ